MSEQLRSALERSRSDIEGGLAEAERELETLRERQAELERLVARARAALGTESEDSAPAADRLTLHNAIALVLRENGNRWMTVRELSAEVNQRRLYRKRDGSPVEANQIHARTKNYAALFEKEGPRIRLRANSDSA